MVMTELTFSLRHPHWEDEREEVTMWVPPPEKETQKEPETVDEVLLQDPIRRTIGIGPWTNFDQYAWPIEPCPSSLVAELSEAVGFFTGGNATGYSDVNGWFEDPTEEFYQERLEVEEYCEAYEKWISENEGLMVDIYQKSRFTEWDIARSCVSYYGVDEHLHDGDGGIIREYTPEALLQKFQLNWRFNFDWNPPLAHWENHPTFGFRFADVQKCVTAEQMVIPDIIQEVEFIKADEKYGLGKSSLGLVYIPSGSVNYLMNRTTPAQTFKAHLFFSGGKYPWRVCYNGVTEITE